MNKVELIGRLTRDVEMLSQEDNYPVAVFTIAIDKGIGKDGEKRGADFPKIKVFGNQAKACLKYIGKGHLVSVVGHLTTSSYTHKTAGIEIFTTEVTAETVEFLTKPKE